MTEATQTDAAQTPGNGEQAAQQGEQQQGQTQEPIKFEDWYTKLEDSHKDLVDDHVSGLKSALNSEREERRKLAKQLQGLSKSAEEGSEFQKQLQDTLGKLEETERKARFMEDAHTQNVTNLKLAWIAAKEDGLVGRDGTVDFAKLREIAPELFERKTAPTGNAGSGSGQGGMLKPDMNSFLRAAAGRPG